MYYRWRYVCPQCRRYAHPSYCEPYLTWTNVLCDRVLEYGHEWDDPQFPEGESKCTGCLEKNEKAKQRMRELRERREESKDQEPSGIKQPHQTGARHGRRM